MNISTLKEAMPFLIDAEVPAMLVGHHGVGKTEGVRQYCRDNGFMLKILNLGTQDVGDIIGLADFLKDKDGQNVATKFMMPDWAREILQFCEANPNKKAVLFLDEINRARRDVLQVIFPLLLEKRIHATTFPKNFYPMGAMNPNTGDYIVTDISDKALMDRFCHIKLSPSRQEFFKYAKDSKFDDRVIQFLTEQPELLQAELEAFGLDEVKPSRRSWEAVNRVLKVKTPVNLLPEIITGLVGSTASASFIKSLSDTDKPISGKQIMDEYSNFKTKVQKYADAKSGGRMDMLKYTADSIVEWVQSDKKALTKDQQKNLADFLWDIPRDLSFGLARELYMEDRTRSVIDDHADLLKDMADKRGMKVKGINDK